jgi:hypothetical protein
MAPNAAVRGNVLSRVANVALPTAGSEIAGGIANAMGASPQVQAGARAVGGLVGAGAGSVRLNALGRQAGPDAETANLLARRGKVDAGAMAQKAQAMRDAGAQPTLIDVAGDRGRRLVRAVGVKNEVAGETLQENARTVSASTKPAVMAKTRTLPGRPDHDRRTGGSGEGQRDAAAKRTTPVPTAPCRSAAFPLPDVIQALRNAPRRLSPGAMTTQAIEIQGLLRAGNKPQPPARLAGLQSAHTPTSLRPRARPTGNGTTCRAPRSIVCRSPLATGGKQLGAIRLARHRQRACSLGARATSTRLLDQVPGLQSPHRL